MGARSDRPALAARVAAAWNGLRESLWFVPALLTVLGAGLAVGTLFLDASVQPERIEHLVLFPGGAEGARGVLDTIGGSIITVTGVVFSVTLIAVQLASSQYTPRVLRNFMADRGNQTVLGVFIATFTYTLIVQRTVRGEIEDTDAFVPSISVAVAVLLALVSVGFLIFFVHHVVRSIQVSYLIDRVTRDALDLLDGLFPSKLGSPLRRDLQPTLPDEAPGTVIARSSGYLQVVDSTALFGTNDDGDEAIVRMEVRIGEFVLPGTVIASIWPASAAEGRPGERVRSAFVFGTERNVRQDLEFPIIELVDIAVKALSPSINDPTTAINCIDRLGEILVALSNREPVSPWRGEPDGALRFLAKPMEFDRLVDLSFNQLRHHGGDDPAVAARLVDTLGRMVRLVPPRHKPVLDRQMRALLRATRQQISDPASQKMVRRARDRAHAPESDGGRAFPRPGNR